MSALDYDPLFLSRSFPKIAVVCGAHTELGEHLLRELLHSPEVDRVHAITSTDIPMLSRLPSALLRKARVHLITFDNLDRALAKIPEADVAFCCLSTDKHAYNSMGRTRFRTVNYDIPARFVRSMFALGVLYVAVLSHPKADPSSTTDLYRLRGNLEDSVRRLRREAGDFSPFISMFKLASLVSHVPSSSRGSPKSRLRDRLSDLVEFRDLARAMRVDALHKSVRSNPASKKKRNKYEEMYAVEVDDLVAEAQVEDETRPFWEY